MLLSAVAFGACGLRAADPAPGRPKLRLGDPVEISLTGMEPACVAFLDNETVVVAGRIKNDPQAETVVASRASGGIVNLKTKAVREFINGHKVMIGSIAHSAGGDRIVTSTSNADLDPFIRFWDAKADKPLEPIKPAPVAEEVGSSFRIATFHRNHKVAVTLKDRVRIIDPTGREEPVDLETEYLSGTFPGELAISPDDKLLACATGNLQIIIWDVGTKKVLYVPSLLPEGENDREWSIWRLAFTKSGTQLIAARGKFNSPDVPRGIPEDKVSAEKRGLFLIDVPKQKTIPLGMGAQILTVHFALHPSEEWIATVGDAYPDKPVPNFPDATVRELRVYHYPTRTLVHKVQFDFDGFGPFWIGFTPDGKKLVAVDAVHDDGKVMAWDFTPVKP